MVRRHRNFPSPTALARNPMLRRTAECSSNVLDSLILPPHMIGLLREGSPNRMLELMRPTHVAHCECFQAGSQPQTFMEMVGVNAPTAHEAARRVPLDSRRRKVVAIEQLGPPFTVALISL